MDNVLVCLHLEAVLFGLDDTSHFAGGFFYHTPYTMKVDQKLSLQYR
jgi:hypothetical protein